MTNEEKQFILLRAAQYAKQCNELSTSFCEHEKALTAVLNRCLQDIEDVRRMQEQVRLSTDIVLEIAAQMRELIERVNEIEADSADWWKSQ